MTREIRSLTGLRGVAAIVVVIFHYSFLPFQDVGHIIASPSGPGYLAVDLFFVLSGFVMASTYAKNFAVTWTLSTYLRFLQKRFARIYPLFFVATLAAFLLTKANLLPGSLHPTRTLFANLLGSQNLGLGRVMWDFGRSLDMPTWSISTELGAYLVFPWLAAIVLFRSGRCTIVTAAASVAGLMTITLLPDALVDGYGRQGPLDVATGATLWPLLRCLCGFTLGLVTYRVSLRPSNWSRSGQIWIDVALVAAVSCLWFVPGTDILIVACFAVLIWTISTDQTPLARLLAHPVPKGLGDVSYALYLTHFFVGVLFSPSIHRLLQAANVPHAWAATVLLCVMVSLTVSWVAYHYLEKPSRDILRHWFISRGTPVLEGAAIR